MWRPFLIAATLFSAPLAHAELAHMAQCNIPLINKEIIAKNKEVSTNVRKWFCAADYGTAKQSNSFGIDVTIPLEDGINIGLGVLSTSDAFEQWANSHCSREERQASLDESYTHIREKIDKTALASRERCIRDSLAAQNNGLTCRLEAIDEAQLQYTFWYKPVNRYDTARPKVLSATVTGASPLYTHSANSRLQRLDTRDLKETTAPMSAALELAKQAAKGRPLQMVPENEPVFPDPTSIRLRRTDLRHSVVASLSTDKGVCQAQTSPPPTVVFDIGVIIRPTFSELRHETDLVSVNDSRDDCTQSRTNRAVAYNVRPGFKISSIGMPYNISSNCPTNDSRVDHVRIDDNALQAHIDYSLKGCGYDIPHLNIGCKGRPWLNAAVPIVLEKEISHSSTSDPITPEATWGQANVVGEEQWTSPDYPHQIPAGATNINWRYRADVIKKVVMEDYAGDHVFQRTKISISSDTPNNDDIKSHASNFGSVIIDLSYSYKTSVEALSKKLEADNNEREREFHKLINLKQTYKQNINTKFGPLVNYPESAEAVKER